MQTKLEWAKDYIAYGVKEGFFEAEDFKNMSDEDLIKFAEEEDTFATYFYEDYLENEATGN